MDKDEGFVDDDHNQNGEPVHDAVHDDTIPLEEEEPDSIQGEMAVEAADVIKIEDPVGKDETTDVPEVVELETFKEPLPDPSQGRKRTNPSPVSKQAPGRKPGFKHIKRPLSPPDFSEDEAQHGWQENRRPLRNIEQNFQSGFLHGAHKRRFGGLDRMQGGYYTTPQPIFPPVRRPRTLQSVPLHLHSGNYQDGPSFLSASNPLFPVPFSGGNANQADHNTATVLPTHSTSPSRASSNPVTSNSPPIHPPPPFNPSVTSSPISPSVYHEVEEPRFALVTCKSFTIEERLPLRVYLNIQDGDKIAKDPTVSGLICVQKSFSDASKAELYKLGFSKAFYASDGQIPQKVIVTLMSKPFITNAAKPFGAVGDAKRSVGRPPKKN